MKISFLLTEPQDKTLLYLNAFKTKIEGLSSPTSTPAQQALDTFFTNLKTIQNNDMSQIQSMWEGIQKEKQQNPNYAPMWGNMFILHNLIKAHPALTIEHVKAVQNLLLTDVKTAIQKSSSKAETK